MRSTDIKAYRVNDFFAVPIITGSSSFAVKFDTGASRTVISIGKIKSNLNKNRLTCVKDYIVKKNIEAHKFKSASGHVITAYPAYIENAMVDNQLFDQLYYYLVIDRIRNNRQIALLGDDFIDCCKFEKEPQGNIIITKFDSGSYGMKKAGISTEEILSLV